MRSGMTSWASGRSPSTPSIRISWLPAPSMRAPMAVSAAARSATSGSRAQLPSTVRPSASAAAIITFSVPVTVSLSKVKVVPRSRPRGTRAST